MAQKRIEQIIAKYSVYGEYPDVTNELKAELQRMWSDLETYKIELEMQNDELMRAFRDAEDVQKDYIELFNSSPVGYLILNSSAIILNANQTFADMVKTELAHIYQQPFHNFIAQQDVSDFLSRFKSYFKNPLQKFFELTINDTRHKAIVVRLEGIRKSISGFAKRSPAGEHNRADGFDGYHSASDDGDNENEEVLLISLSDISLLKQAEEEKEALKNLLLQSHKMEAIGTLAAGIAHDFNNILFPILGFGEMLKDELSARENIYDPTRQEEMTEMAESIITNSLRAKDLVKQILAFSKNTSTAVNSLHLNMILMEIIVSLRPLLPSNIRLVERIDNTCSMVMADAEQIHQVIFNIISNAIDSMEEIGGTVTITLTENDFHETCQDTGASVNGRYVCLSIADTGHGIEKQYLSRIFDPYFSTRTKFKWAGLGLSLVHGIIHSHNGAITVKSEPGLGSEFRIFLPCYAKPDEQPGLLKNKLARGNERIMVIDDQPYITKLISTMLQRLGYSVVTYNDPLSAIDNLRDGSESVDIILTDMTMPTMTGDNVAREVMQIVSGMPVIILTGYSDKLSSTQAADMGIKGYLMKPVSLADLSDAVRQALDAQSK